jgi:hypothetical protein
MSEWIWTYALGITLSQPRAGTLKSQALRRHKTAPVAARMSGNARSVPSRGVRSS